MTPKIAQKNCLGAPGPPRVSREPFWNNFDLIFTLASYKHEEMAHGRPHIPRFGREKWCLNAAKPRNFIIFPLQNVTVRYFLAFWKLFFYRGSFKHTVFTRVRASEALLGLILGLLGLTLAILGLILGFFFGTGGCDMSERAAPPGHQTNHPDG